MPLILAPGAALAAFVAQTAFPGQNGRIAFASRTAGKGANNPTGDYEIFMMNPDGTGITQLTNHIAQEEKSK